MKKLKFILNVVLIFSLICSAIPVFEKTSVAANAYDVEDGEYYYIKNVQSKSYIDIQNQNMANGTLIHQWKYHGHWTQRWKFELRTNGYYSISSAVSGTKYYLAVQNGSALDGTAIVLKSGAVTSDMLWKIEQTSLGYFKIVPKLGESLNRVMAVVYNSNQSTNGLHIKELTYSNDGHRSDEWILYCARDEVTPKHYYDAALGLRYPTTNSAYLVETAQNMSSEFFLSNFGIFASPTYSAFSSKPDICEINRFGSIPSNQLDVISCTHNPSCHNTGEMLSHLIDQKGPSSAPAAKVLWTGHKTLGHGRSYYNTHFGAVLLTSSEAPDFVASNKGTVFDAYTYELHHEMSHRFGANDHYCTADPPGSGCDQPFCDLCVYNRESIRDCIMSTYKNLGQDSEASIHCVDCIIRIRLYLNEYVCN